MTRSFVCFLSCCCVSPLIFASDGREAVPASRAVKVACMGTSITAGYMASSPSHSWPAQLQGLLGSGYEVLNFGHSGATIQHEGTDCDPRTPHSFSYWSTPEFDAAVSSLPDIAVIEFGANDGKNCNWNATRFTAAYEEAISVFAGLPSRPHMFLVVPPPIYAAEGVFGGMNRTVINDLVPPIVRAEAEDHQGFSPRRALHSRGLEHPVLIEVHPAFVAHCADLEATCDWMADGVHPNDEGYRQFASVVNFGILSAALAVTAAPTPAPTAGPTPAPTQGDANTSAAVPLRLGLWIPLVALLAFCGRT